MTPEQIAGLEALLEQANSGPWDAAIVDEIWRLGLSAYANANPNVFGEILADAFDGTRSADSALAASAPTLARHVLTQQAQITALAEDAARSHDLALENARMRGWLSEIDMRAKQYDPEDLADLARDGLNGKPLEGVQP